MLQLNINIARADILRSSLAIRFMIPVFGVGIGVRAAIGGREAGTEKAGGVFFDEGFYSWGGDAEEAGGNFDAGPDGDVVGGPWGMRNVSGLGYGINEERVGQCERNSGLWGPK